MISIRSTIVSPFARVISASAICAIIGYRAPILIFNNIGFALFLATAIRTPITIRIIKIVIGYQMFFPFDFAYRAGVVYFSPDSAVIPAPDVMVFRVVMFQ